MNFRAIKTYFVKKSGSSNPALRTRTEQIRTYLKCDWFGFVLKKEGIISYALFLDLLIYFIKKEMG